VRQHEIIVDEPSSAGGTDTGPMPTEVFLASLASCFTLSVYHAARKRSIELPDLSVRARGRYVGLRFEHLTVEVSSSCPRDQLQGLIEPAIRYCYVSQTLKHQPGIEYVIVDPPPAAPGVAPGVTPADAAPPPPG
jgi:uncharacterized OsmC-like protein